MRIRPNFLKKLFTNLFTVVIICLKGVVNLKSHNDSKISEILNQK
jgi:hypothetical protein